MKYLKLFEQYNDWVKYRLDDRYLSTEKIIGNTPVHYDNEEWAQVGSYMTNYYREYLYKDYPTIKIDYNKLIPTQTGLNKDNIKYIIDNYSNEEDTGAIIVKWNNKFYIWEGHHRICAKILTGNKKILAHIIDYDDDSIKYKDSRRFIYEEDNDDQWLD